MLLNIEQISQPYSGEYEEIIFDIESNWNSSDWSWIRFEEDTTIWCGEFRGKYIGATFSVPKGIIVVVTTDYIYVIDIVSKEMIDSSHYFRDTDQYEKLMWGFSYISFCLSKHFGESDVFVSFLLTASL
jgi:hypothetical protein